MAKPKYKTFRSVQKATAFIENVMELPISKRIVEGYRFPEGMTITCRKVTFVNCVLRKVKFDCYIGKLKNCDLTGSDMNFTKFGRDGMILVDCILDGIFNRTLLDDEIRRMNKKQLKAFPMRCPREGSYIAYKKCKINWDLATKYGLPNNEVVVRLEIPADAQRVSSGGDKADVKCRASKAKVLGIRSVDPSSKTKKTVVFKKARSEFDRDFVYEVGKVVKPTTKFDPCRWNICSTGIHHFMTREEAAIY